MSEALGITLHSTYPSCMRDVQSLLRAVKPRPLTLTQLRENTSWTSPEISACLCKLREAKKVSRFLPLNKGTRGYAYIWIAE